MRTWHDHQGLAIRLTDERLAYLLEHPQIKGLELAIEETLARREDVVQSITDPTEKGAGVFSPKPSSRDRHPWITSLPIHAHLPPTPSGAGPLTNLEQVCQEKTPDPFFISLFYLMRTSGDWRPKGMALTLTRRDAKPRGTSHRCPRPQHSPWTSVPKCCPNFLLDRCTGSQPATPCPLSRCLSGKCPQFCQDLHFPCPVCSRPYSSRRLTDGTPQNRLLSLPRH